VLIGIVVPVPAERPDFDLVGGDLDEEGFPVGMNSGVLKQVEGGLVAEVFSKAEVSEQKFY
jgi:hypothetical protein